MLQKISVLNFSGALLISLGVSQLFVPSLLADDLVNITDIEDCKRVSGDVERLSCFDIVINGGVFNEQKLREVQVQEFGSNTMPKEAAPEPVVEAEPEKATAAVATPAGEPAKQTETVAERTVTPDELGVTIVRLKKGNGGIYYYQTSDGQVWKQQNATSWNIKAPFDARIKKGAMGSFFLVHDGGKSTRVKRVR